MKEAFRKFHEIQELIFNTEVLPKILALKNIAESEHKINLPLIYPMVFYYSFTIFYYYFQLLDRRYYSHVGFFKKFKTFCIMGWR